MQKAIDEVHSRAKLKVGHDNSDLGARDDENDKHDKEKRKDVVELMAPDGGEDEEELDEHGAERQHAAHQHREQRRQIPHLFWNLHI
jgi:hypothetical protein